jgi:diguanylate cyclase (GGDEF)-like protein
VARMGGDEFVVLLPGVKPHDVEGKLVQFRDLVKKVGADIFASSTLTASIGVAHFPLDGTDAEQLLAEADKRMYKEKQSQKQSIPRDAAWAGEWTTTVQ